MMDTHSCTLLNVGDNTRIVHDHEGKPVTIGIGETQSCTLGGPLVDFIVKAMPKDTLILIPDGAELPPNIVAALELIAEVRNGDYDQLLVRMRDLLGAANIEKVRPTRGEMMEQLRSITFDHVQERLGNPKGGKTFVKEDVPKEGDGSLDDMERRYNEQRPEQPRRNEETPPPSKPAQTYKEQRDEAPNRADDDSDGVLEDVVAGKPKKRSAK